MTPARIVTVSDVSSEISLQRLLSVDFRDLRDWRRDQIKLPFTPGHETG